MATVDKTVTNALQKVLPKSAEVFGDTAKLLNFTELNARLGDISRGLFQAIDAGMGSKEMLGSDLKNVASIALSEMSRMLAASGRFKNDEGSQVLDLNRYKIEVLWGEVIEAYVSENYSHEVRARFVEKKKLPDYESWAYDGKFEIYPSGAYTESVLDMRGEKLKEALDELVRYWFVVIMHEVSHAALRKVGGEIDRTRAMVLDEGIAKFIELLYGKGLGLELGDSTRAVSTVSAIERISKDYLLEDFVDMLQAVKPVVKEVRTALAEYYASKTTDNTSEADRLTVGVHLLDVSYKDGTVLSYLIYLGSGKNLGKVVDMIYRLRNNDEFLTAAAKGVEKAMLQNPTTEQLQAIDQIMLSHFERNHWPGD